MAKKTTHLYIYRLTCDSGLAPCIDGGKFSLAVCKGGKIYHGNKGDKVVNTGLRYEIGHDWKKTSEKEEIYVIGIYKNKFLYLARITEVMTMMDYYQGESAGRMDDIYYVKDGELKRNQKLRNYRFQSDRIHTDKDDIRRDIAGEYVLLSNDFIYLGKNAEEIKRLTKDGPKFRETKEYTGKDADEIIAACRKHKNKPTAEHNDVLMKNCGGCR